MISHPEEGLVPEVEVVMPADGFSKIVGGHVLDLGSEGDGSFGFDRPELSNGSHPSFKLRVIEVLRHGRLGVIFPVS